MNDRNPDLVWEKEQCGTHGLVAGVDEVGRGAIAGPVVAAAVVMPSYSGIKGIKDSKLIASARRFKLASEIGLAAMVGVGVAGVREIEQLNILQATLLAMTRALANLPCRPEAVLVDGNFVPQAYADRACARPKADQTSLSVAAASIYAKCWRDSVMHGLAGLYPQYGWHTNVGYGTVEHKAAIRRYGICRWHRASFAPCRELAKKKGTGGGTE